MAAGFPNTRRVITKAQNDKIPMNGHNGRSRSSPVSPVPIMNGTKRAPCTPISPKTTMPATEATSVHEVKVDGDDLFVRIVET